MERKKAAADAQRVCRELAALPETSMRRAALIQRLEALPAEKAAALMELLWYSWQAEPSRFAPLTPFFQEWREYLQSLPYETRQDLYEVAVRRGHRGLQRAFFSPRLAAEHRRERGPDFLDPLLDQLTLGEKRALARSRRRASVKRLLADDSPLVVAALLDNPMVTLPDVLKMTSKRPANPKALQVIFRHPRWNGRVEVRRSLLLNPWTPRHTAEQLAAGLNAGELRRALKLAGADQELLHRIRECLAARRCG